MIDQGSVPSLMGSTVRDSSGDKIGKVGQVYLDDTTGLPEWVTVRTGLFGTRESFVPLASARVEGDELIVDVTKDRVGDAPQIDEDGHLSEEQEAELYRYYGVDPGPFGSGVGPSDGDLDRSAADGAYADQLVEDGLAEPGPGAADDPHGPAVGILERPSHEALPDSGFAAGTSGVDPEEYGGRGTAPGTDPALRREGGPAVDPTLDPALDPALDAELDRAGTEKVEPGRSRLRRWMAGDS